MPVLSALSCSNPTLVFGLFLLLFYFVLMCFAYMHVCVHERLMFIETKKKALHPLQLELQMVVGCHLYLTWTWVPLAEQPMLLTLFPNLDEHVFMHVLSIYVLGTFFFFELEFYSQIHTFWRDLILLVKLPSNFSLISSLKPGNSSMIF